MQKKPVIYVIFDDRSDNVNTSVDTPNAADIVNNVVASV